MNKIKEYAYKHKLPYQALWILNDNCNLNCKHCFFPKKPSYVSYDEAIKIIEFMKQKNILEVILTGGECTINPDFIKIYLKLKQEGFLVHILTNGVAISDELKKILAKYKPYTIQVSLYGYDENSYLLNTGNANFNNVYEFAKFCKENGIKLIFKYLLTNYYINILPDVKKKFDIFGFPYIFATYVFKDLDKRKDISNMRPHNIVEILSSQNNLLDNIKIDPNNLQECTSFFKKCQAGITNFTFDKAIGLLYCELDYNHKFLFKDYKSLDATFEAVKKYRIQIENKFNNSECAHCKYVLNCPGCPIHLQIENDDCGLNCNEYFREQISERLI